MITGIVNVKLEATLAIQVLGPTGQSWYAQTVIDTGYNGKVMKPLSVVNTLSLVKGAAREVTLGDTSRRVFEYYTAEIVWDGQPHKVRVFCIEGDPLIGTALLADYTLEADFVIGGLVTLKPRDTPTAKGDC